MTKVEEEKEERKGEYRVSERNKDLLRLLKVMNLLTITIAIANTRIFTMNICFDYSSHGDDGGKVISRESASLISGNLSTKSDLQSYFNLFCALCWPFEGSDFLLMSDH